MKVGLAVLTLLFSSCVFAQGNGNGSLGNRVTALEDQAVITDSRLNSVEDRVADLEAALADIESPEGCNHLVMRTTSIYPVLLENDHPGAVPSEVRFFNPRQSDGNAPVEIRCAYIHVTAYVEATDPLTSLVFAGFRAQKELAPGVYTEHARLLARLPAGSENTANENSSAMIVPLTADGMVAYRVENQLHPAVTGAYNALLVQVLGYYEP